MILTKDITSGKSIPSIVGNKQGEGSKNLLDLSPSDVVFYVGGYPANFTVSSPPSPLPAEQAAALMPFSSSPSASSFSQLPHVRGLHRVLLH